MTRVFGLVGHPVAHSLSPAMHRVWIAAAGLDAVYLPFEIAPDTPGVELMSALRTLRLDGVNLTVPFKERVLGCLDALGDSASRIGAVNTVVREGDRWVGHNTDAAGFVAGVREAGTELAGATVVVLGAGGAARAVVVGVADAGADRVIVLNRTVPRARAVAESLDPVCPSTEIVGAGFEAFDAWAPRAGLVVVAVSRPGRPSIARLDSSTIPDDALWVDLNYWDADPPHLRTLRDRGVAVQDGRPMLLHQGALAFERFTGCTADPSQARSTLGGGIGA